MKRLVVLAIFCICTGVVLGTGVVLNSAASSYGNCQLQSTIYQATVTDQVANVVCTESFRNQYGTTITPRLYFPKPRGSHVTAIRWEKDGTWHSATLQEIGETPPGASFEFPDSFVLHMQLMPLIFQPATTLQPYQNITFEVTYIYMLDYTFGTVNLNLRNDYSRIQTTPLLHQEMSVFYNSNKTIVDFDVKNLAAAETFSEHTAYAHYELNNAPAEADYNVMVSLSTSQLGSWAMSTYLASVPDQGAHGFFLVNSEEQSLPADSSYAATVILVIDVSGSMTFENRLENAKEAASYVINNLSPNDTFNVILFDHVCRPWRSAPSANTPANVAAALSYINYYSIYSLNGTNLDGGLQAALDQLPIATPNRKNIVVLFSDGQPNVGVTDTYQIVNRADATIASHHSNAYIFSLGIGLDVNYPLLNMLALRNKGIAIFVQSDDLSDTVASFYYVMRNPNILYPSISLTNPGIISEVYPVLVPALYGGVQYRIVGRYSTAQPFSVNLSGLHEGVPHTYTYPVTPSNAENEQYSFIPKLWASAKIDQLMLLYYSYPSNSAIAQEYRQQVVELSLQYGVPTTFTAYIDPTDIEDEEATPPAHPVVLNQNYPNPFNPETTISFDVIEPFTGEAVIEIFNVKGQLVRSYRILINRKGRYEVVFDGRDQSGDRLSSGIYLYKLTMGKTTQVKKMILSK